MSAKGKELLRLKKSYFVGVLLMDPLRFAETPLFALQRALDSAHIQKLYKKMLDDPCANVAMAEANVLIGMKTPLLCAGKYVNILFVFSFCSFIWLTIVFYRKWYY